MDGLSFLMLVATVLLSGTITAVAYEHRASRFKKSNVALAVVVALPVAIAVPGALIVLSDPSAVFTRDFWSDNSKGSAFQIWEILSLLYAIPALLAGSVALFIAHRREFCRRT
jgi:hypothetical protein